MIKLVASDIDGTLVKDSTPELYPEMLDTIHQLTDSGIRFVAASGRSYQSIRHMFWEVEDKIAYIAENGAHIIYQGNDLKITEMKHKYVEEIVNHLREYKNTCDIIVSTPNGSLVETSNQEFLNFITKNYKIKLTLVEDVTKTQERILKIAAYQPGSIRELGENILIPKWNDRVKACMSGEEWVDFMDASVDKGNALHYLQEYFEIDKEETMAFGDNSNDVGMMLAARESYAVENARAEVKAAAKNRCPSYQEKGVWQVLQTLL